MCPCTHIPSVTSRGGRTNNIPSARPPVTTGSVYFPGTMLRRHDFTALFYTHTHRHTRAATLGVFAHFSTSPLSLFMFIVKELKTQTSFPGRSFSQQLHRGKARAWYCFSSAAEKLSAAWRWEGNVHLWARREAGSENGLSEVSSRFNSLLWKGTYSLKMSAWGEGCRCHCFYLWKAYFCWFF